MRISLWAGCATLCALGLLATGGAAVAATDCATINREIASLGPQITAQQEKANKATFAYDLCVQGARANKPPASNDPNVVCATQKADRDSQQAALQALNERLTTMQAAARAQKCPPAS